MSAPLITAFYAALAAILLVVFGFRVAYYRMTRRIGLGTGDDRNLEKRIRVHGNAAEYLPMAIVLLALLELTGSTATVLHACGATLIAARTLHGIGLSRHAGASWPRFAGIVVTWGVMLAMATLLLMRAAA